MKKIEIGDRPIGDGEPLYFIADIAANHDRNLERAKDLIHLSAEAGANAVKFQHHNVAKYVSAYGFESLGKKVSHQKSWQKSIFEVYKEAEVPLEWTKQLKEFSDEAGVDFFSTPYDLDMVNHLNPYVPAYKIGSGDLIWDAMLEKTASTGKPIFISSGACTLGEVIDALACLKKRSAQVVLMQCNTNYTGEIGNLKYINLNVLDTYRNLFPDVVLGLSDHTPGCVSVLGAVAKGARVIEKHFTDDTTRVGPDHKFSMDPRSWKEMVDRACELELALGGMIKKVEDNELETVVLQRRSIRVIKDMYVGESINIDDVQFQRPAPSDSFYPNMIDTVLGKKIKKEIKSSDYLRNEHIDW